MYKTKIVKEKKVALIRDLNARDKPDVLSCLLCTAGRDTMCVIDEDIRQRADTRNISFELK